MASGSIGRSVTRPVKTCTECKQVKVSPKMIVARQENVADNSSSAVIPNPNFLPLVRDVRPGVYIVPSTPHSVGHQRASKSN
jgi:hypothetical protein